MTMSSAFHAVALVLAFLSGGMPPAGKTSAAAPSPSASAAGLVVVRAEPASWSAADFSEDVSRDDELTETDDDDGEDDAALPCDPYHPGGSRLSTPSLSERPAGESASAAGPSAARSPPLG